MPPLSLLIKPASSSCDLRCRYCFYADVAEHREVASFGMMSAATLENVVRQSLDAASGECAFSFQGGEPTLAGLDFFRSLTDLVERHNKKKLSVRYAIQTNGCRIDGEWARFLARHRFLVGLSLDGGKDLHDLHRLAPGGKGTFSRVMRAAQLLTRHGAEFNILTVITAPLAKNIGKAYGFFKRNGFHYQQYIPCLDPLEEERGGHAYSLTPPLYGEFLCRLFDLWYNDVTRGQFVSVRYFENLLQILKGHPPESCGMLGQCTCQNVVEADGSVYPCDFYVLDEYRLGSLNTDSYADIHKRHRESEFVPLSRHVSPECRDCQWYPLCRGGCRRDREPLKDGVLSLTYFCESYKEFFAYAYPRLAHLARQIR